MTSFCPRCGASRLGNFRFCRSCGLDFDSLGAQLSTAGTGLNTTGADTTVQPARVPPWTAAESAAGPLAARSHNPIVVGGGIAWIVAAVAIGYLALLQLGYAGTTLDNGSFEALAIWNGIAAAITVYFGARLLMSPTRSTLHVSVIWAAISVASGAYQIANGATHELFLLSTLAAGVAGVLSLAASSGATQDPNGVTCVNCGKRVDRSRQKLCNHCGLPFAEQPKPAG